MSISPLEKFRVSHGPAMDCEPASDTVLQRYADRLPSELIEEWRTRGWCAYAKGQVWLVNPEAYIEIMQAWLPDWCKDKDEQPIVFARAAFGDLLVSYQGFIGHLSVHYGRYIVLGQRRVDVFLGYSLDESYVAEALDGKLALRAIKKIGHIASDEMFTFEPALALGGSPELKCVKKVKLFPQLSLLVQLYDEITIE